MAYLDDYDDSQAKGGKRIPRVLIVVGVIAFVAALGFLLVGLLGQREQPQQVTPDDETTDVRFEGDESGSTTESNIVGGQPEEITTEVDIEGEPGDQQEETQPADDQGVEHMGDNSSSIPIEQKMAMAEGNEIDAGTEEKYAQYGALNIDRMQDVARRFTSEWTQMINDSQWDAHSTVLKSMMDIDYIKNHSEEFEVMWLYQCVMDSLYISKASMQYGDVADVRIVNSVPSPLTYAKIRVNVAYQGTDGTSPGIVTYKMAMNKDYQVCRFAVDY